MDLTDSPPSTRRRLRAIEIDENARTMALLEFTIDDDGADAVPRFDSSPHANATILTDSQFDILESRFNNLMYDRNNIAHYNSGDDVSNADGYMDDSQQRPVNVRMDVSPGGTDLNALTDSQLVAHHLRRYAEGTDVREDYAMGTYIDESPPRPVHRIMDVSPGGGTNLNVLTDSQLVAHHLRRYDAAEDANVIDSRMGILNNRKRCGCCCCCCHRRRCRRENNNETFTINRNGFGSPPPSMRRWQEYSY